MAIIDFKITLDSGATIGYSYQGDINPSVVCEAQSLLDLVKTRRAQVSVLGLAEAPDKIKGIKAIRALSGLALREAKDLADKVMGYGADGYTLTPQRLTIPGFYTKQQALDVMDLLKAAFSEVELF